jgi:serine phosphatase RsbU (regulator of sigma subunit)
MASLLVLDGPQLGQEFPLTGECARIGREPEADVCLPGRLVSRNHARIWCVDGDYFVEDLGSRNGTLLNGAPITGRVPLTPQDRLEVGEFILGLCLSPDGTLADADLVIREQVDAVASNPSLYAHNPAYKLKVLLEITQDLGTALEVQPLLEALLGHLLRLFPRADRGMVLLCEHDHLVPRAQRSRHGLPDTDFPYSRTIVQKSLADGLGLLIEDVHRDQRFDQSESLRAGSMHSVLCVPLLCKDGQRLGVLQLDRITPGTPFQSEDLQLLTALALQVAVVLENVALQGERLRQEILRKELAVARDIQSGFLPTDFAAVPAGLELFASVHPAREVSGDLYDFFRLDDGRLALFLGDVSGKGMPAALFMVAVRTLARHLVPLSSGPAETLARLNDALAADNPSAMFVTLAHGLYEPDTGEVVLVCGGHPPPLRLRGDGGVEEVAMPPGRLLGFAPGLVRLKDTRLSLARGETLIFYSDGFTEAFAPDDTTMFGLEGLQSALASCAGMPLPECAARIQSTVRRFAGSQELQDDQTLLLVRRM